MERCPERRRRPAAAVGCVVSCACVSSWRHTILSCCVTPSPSLSLSSLYLCHVYKTRVHSRPLPEHSPPECARSAASRRPRARAAL